MNTKIIDLEDYLENREEMPDIQAIAGERWFPEETARRSSAQAGKRSGQF